VEQVKHARGSWTVSTVDRDSIEIEAIDFEIVRKAVQQ